MSAVTTRMHGVKSVEIKRVNVRDFYTLDITVTDENGQQFVMEAFVRGACPVSIVGEVEVLQEVEA